MMNCAKDIKLYREAYCKEVDRVVSALLVAYKTPGGVVELHDVGWISAEIGVLQNMLDVFQRRLRIVRGISDRLAMFVIDGLSVGEQP